MRRFLLSIVAPAAASISLWNGIAAAQTPTYAPTSPLVAPGDPITTPEGTFPQSTIPQSTVPPTTTTPPIVVPGNSYSAPGNGYSVPSGNAVDPAATIVTPGSVTPYGGFGRGWYPGYWLGIRPNDPPFGSGPVPYQTNYQGFAAPYGAPAGGCNTCPTPCGPQNLDFGRGYDGFMTGW